MQNVEFLLKNSSEIEPYLAAIADLRLQVFYEFPYLYDGTREYEAKYLEKYLNSKRSICVLALHHGKVIGCTTGLPLIEEEADVKDAFKNDSHPLEQNFYFGESVLLPEFRGQGIGKLFFKYRENFARSFTREGSSAVYNRTSFCSVVRPIDHPLMPTAYQPLNSFWFSQGYEVLPGAVAKMSWKDRSEKIETEKKLQFWKKDWLDV